jgi:hypothetical protein
MFKYCLRKTALNILVRKVVERFGGYLRKLRNYFRDRILADLEYNEGLEDLRGANSFHFQEHARVCEQPH